MDILKYARRTSCFSVGLGLAVSIFQLWIVYHTFAQGLVLECIVRTVCKKDFVFRARVRVSSQYFPVLDCVSFSCARKRSWLSLWLGLAVYFAVWNVYRTVRKKAFMFLASG